MTGQGYLMRIVWPIVDPTVPAQQIGDELVADLPAIAGSLGARLTGRARFRITRAAQTPGSRRATTYCLVMEAPAVKIPPRPYRNGASR